MLLRASGRRYTLGRECSVGRPARSHGVALGVPPDPVGMFPERGLSRMRLTAITVLDPLKLAPSLQLAESLTLGTGFAYGSLRNRELYVAQQTCCPEVRERKLLLAYRENKVLLAEG